MFLSYFRLIVPKLILVEPSCENIPCEFGNRKNLKKQVIKKIIYYPVLIVLNFLIFYFVGKKNGFARLLTVKSRSDMNIGNKYVSGKTSKA